MSYRISQFPNFPCPKSNYKGYLDFVSKTALIGLYRDKYYAQSTIGQKMYIDPIGGKKLIEEYLNRKKDEA